MRLVKPFRELKYLGLEGTSVTAAGLREIADLPQLQMLGLSGSAAADDAMEVVAQMTMLETLTLPNDITDKGVAHLVTLVRLRSLRTTGKLLTDRSLDYIVQLRCLDSLTIGPLITMDGLKKVATMELGMVPFRTQDGDEALALFEGATSFRALHVRGTQVTDDGLAVIRTMTSLQEFTPHESITSAGMAHLHGMKSIEVLNLEHTSLVVSDLAVLRSLPSLQRLTLPPTIGNEAAEIAASCEDLRILKLNGALITDEFLDRFPATQRAFHSLTLARTRISPDAIARWKLTHPAVKVYVDDFWVRDAK
jgi:hypothetical protein